MITTTTPLPLALPADLIALQHALLAADRVVGDFALAVRDRRRAAFPEPHQAVQRCTWNGAEQAEFDARWAAYEQAGAALRAHPVLVRARVLGIEPRVLQALRRAALN
ncbi:hypothetical protein [Kitasatospora viridis]|uniref:Chorismate mutase n=1 Tax=Kitasatospora viridis TaxID=281105 RepID=A0A561TU08_9ACTN|nr:hypothetical protein [Kitasatospora viridis]TWF90577.1 hypothetical protein FHX73_13625 [Kitasatospora viridis]